jgi:hypothetical protein
MIGFSVGHLPRAEPHLSSLALQAAYALLLPLPTHLCLGFFVLRTVTSAFKTKHEVEGALLLDVVVRKSAPVLELLSGENQALLVGRNSLLVLDFLHMRQQASGNARQRF